MKKLTDPRIFRANEASLNFKSQSVGALQTQKIRRAQRDLP